MYYSNVPYKYAFRIDGLINDGKWSVTRLHAAQKYNYMSNFIARGYPDWNNVVVF
jgi:hypothetical protein